MFRAAWQAPVVVLDGRCLRGEGRGDQKPHDPELSYTRGGGGRLRQHLASVLPEPAAFAANAAPVHAGRPDIEGARLLIESALAERRKVLTEMESKALLSAFHIPVTKTMLAPRTANEAMMIATQLGFRWR